MSFSPLSLFFLHFCSVPACVYGCVGLGNNNVVSYRNCYVLFPLARTQLALLPKELYYHRVCPTVMVVWIPQCHTDDGKVR